MSKFNKNVISISEDYIDLFNIVKHLAEHQGNISLELVSHGPNIEVTKTKNNYILNLLLEKLLEVNIASDITLNMLIEEKTLKEI